MVQVRERHIKNSRIWVMFYNIPCVRNQVAFKQLTYVGKLLRREASHVPTRFLTAWCNNPRKRGRPLLTNKDTLFRNLRLIILSVDNAGSVATWGFHALDASYWFLLVAPLNHPANTTPDYPPEDKETDRNPSQSSSSSSPPRSSHSTSTPGSPPPCTLGSERASVGSEGFDGP